MIRPIPGPVVEFVEWLRSYLDRVDPAFLETVRHDLDVIAGLDAPPEQEDGTVVGEVVDHGASPASDTDLEQTASLQRPLRQHATGLVERAEAVQGITAELIGAHLAARYGDAYYALGTASEPEQSREDDLLAAWLAETEFADAFDGCCVLSGDS
ncbi:hypothetical protein BRC61_07280 [Halobacteriales archaeon QH_10_65_19]|nr:MAG: hypothetical protein BRC61_07280 [Halobacteriales archaeon QH_10_65_19]